MKTTGTLIVKMTQSDKSKPGQGPRVVQTFFRCREGKNIDIFLAVNVKQCWLNNVGSLYLVMVSWISCWSTVFERIILPLWLASHWPHQF